MLLGGFYLPAYNKFTVAFAKQILSGKKKVLLLNYLQAFQIKDVL
jgi:hypothetical protein